MELGAHTYRVALERSFKEEQRLRTESALFEAAQLQARRDKAALAMENAALARQVRELGGVPVSRSSEEWLALYERCAEVVRAASMLVAHLGTSKEMLEEFS